MGPLIIKELARRGHHLTIFNRETSMPSLPKDAVFVHGDREQGFTDVKGKFDVVIDTCAYRGTHTKNALENLKFDFYLHVSTVAAYQKTEIFPITEDAPIGIWPCWGDYNKGKIECEETLAASGRLYATIRPVYIIGAKNHIPREQFIYQKLCRGETIVAPGNGQALIQFAFVQDVARAIATIAEQKARGAWNCAGDEIISLKGLVEAMATITKTVPKIKYNPATDSANHDEAEFPFANEHMICSNAKIKTLGTTFTPLLEGLRADYESYYKKLCM